MQRILLAIVLTVSAWASTLPAAAAPALGENSCERLVGERQLLLALEPCRQAVLIPGASCSLLRSAALAEFEAGDALAAADLLRRVLEGCPWSEEVALDHAAAVWRGGQVAEAEAELRSVLARTGSSGSAARLATLLLAYGRYPEIPPLAKDALEKDPKACTLAESWGVAEAAAGNAEGAAPLFRRAIDGGCPPFRWTGIGPMSGMLRNPAFAGLLAPHLLLDGIGSLAENEALQRLNLLDATLDAGAAPALANLVRTTRSGAIRLQAVALLGKLGPGPMVEWTSLLASSSSLVRRVALKQVLELSSTVFVPLLTKYLESEALPGNRALASLALARLFGAQGQTTEAIELLTSIPEGEDVYPVALGDLAGIAEKEGRTDEALRLREKARTAADRQRMIAAPDETAPGVPRNR